MTLTQTGKHRFQRDTKNGGARAGYGLAGYGLKDFGLKCVVGMVAVWMVTVSCAVASTVVKQNHPGAQPESVSDETVHTPVVIAHRGASAYLPEHTLAAKVLAHAMGADYLEQDLVMTKDGELVVLHDLYLDRVSDVAQKFPGRARDDGRFYVIDFTLDELRTLNISERRKHDDANQAELAFPGRFGLNQSRFGVHTFSEELELIQELNRLTGKEVGIYPEIKSPSFHHQNGQDIAAATLEVLKTYGYDTPQSKVYLQSFDPNELIRLDTELMPQMGVDIPLVQLIARTRWQLTQEQAANGQWVNYDYDWMLEPGAMVQIAEYADGVGPHIGMLIKSNTTGGQQTGAQANSQLVFNHLVSEAQAQGLAVHPYTVRADRLPRGVSSLEELHALLFETAGVDGIFTDFPDRAVQYLGR